MEKQHKLVIEILRRLSNAEVLPHILLIGSWCAAYYKEYFKGVDYHPSLRTRDIDFLVPRRPRFPKKLDMESLLADLGFECEFYGNGYIKLENDELSIEWLVPETGPGRGNPFPLPQLTLNAQPLRHISMLWRDPIQVRIAETTVHLPHPADYCLQKLIILGQRKEAHKKSKDYATALLVLDSLIEKEGSGSLRAAYGHLTRREKQKVTAVLQKSGRSQWLLGL